MIDYVNEIQKSGLTIYDTIDSNNSLYIPTNDLETILNNSLAGFSLNGLALRTRSKVVKTKICEALGYPVPKSFAKSQPRFPGQNFDTYTQKSLNVQIWNEEIDPSRRYVFIRIDDKDIITKIKIITGDELAKYDNTGTLTKKYQATMVSRSSSMLFSSDDTEIFKSKYAYEVSEPVSLSILQPNAIPKLNQLLSIKEIYNRLLPLVGTSINHVDAVQERNRGAELHKLICQKLGYYSYADDGTYPDILHQLIEIKLQTSPTIDLGLHSPEDNAVILKTDEATFTSADIRYVIFDGVVKESRVLLKALYVINGKDFTTEFPLFKGKVQNAKLQLPLPTDFFD